MRIRHSEERHGAQQNACTAVSKTEEAAERKSQRPRRGRFEPVSPVFFAQTKFFVSLIVWQKTLANSFFVAAVVLNPWACCSAAHSHVVFAALFRHPKKLLARDCSFQRTN